MFSAADFIGALRGDFTTAAGVGFGDRRKVADHCRRREARLRSLGRTPLPHLRLPARLPQMDGRKPKDGRSILPKPGDSPRSSRNELLTRRSGSGCHAPGHGDPDKSQSPQPGALCSITARLAPAHVLQSRTACTYPEGALERDCPASFKCSTDRTFVAADPLAAKRATSPPSSDPHRTPISTICPF